ncbi:MAG: ChbG/HpnK family deacetylase [Spirochaetales bacterium]|nr:ChbG/HpnK family deacetylase [Spirochaetales bacterium]
MLIVNADDFGLAPHINRGIIEAVEAGAVNSVSLVANGTALPEAVAFCRRRRGLDTGIHFALIDEMPVSPPSRIHSLIGKRERFYPDYRHFIIRYLFGRIRLEEIAIELESQLKKILDTGLTLSHCDSHQHLHLLPGIADIVLALCKQYGIGRVRIVNERPDAKYAFQIPPLILMRFFSWMIGNKARTMGIKTAGRFFGFNTSMRINRSIIKKAARTARYRDVELMTHPGYNTNSPGRYARWKMNWDRERETLLDAFVKNPD